MGSSCLQRSLEDTRLRQLLIAALDRIPEQLAKHLVFVHLLTFHISQAISVALQLYGCRMNARKGRAGGHWGEALIAQLLQDKVLNFSGQTVE